MCAHVDITSTALASSSLALECGSSMDTCLSSSSPIVEASGIFGRAAASERGGERNRPEERQWSAMAGGGWTCRSDVCKGRAFERKNGRRQSRRRGPKVQGLETHPLRACARPADVIAPPGPRPAPPSVINYVSTPNPRDDMITFVTECEAVFGRDLCPNSSRQK